jgi:hypothetical protein
MLSFTASSRPTLLMQSARARLLFALIAVLALLALSGWAVSP